MSEPIRIELKSIRFNQAQTRETNSYSANLYVDGVFVAQIGNDGGGGCDVVLGPGKSKDMGAAMSAYDEASRRVPLELPKVDMAYEGEEPRMEDDSLEYLCARIVERDGVLKHIARLTRSKMLAFIDGLPAPGRKAPLSMWRIDSPAHAEKMRTAILAKYPNAYFVNGLSNDDAVTAYGRIGE